MSCRYQYNGQWLTEQQLKEQLNEERYIQTDSGVRSEFFNSPAVSGTAVYADPRVGKYTDLLREKEKTLREYRHRINQINNKRKQKNVSQAELTALNNEKRILEKEINGIPGIEVGLIDQIIQLEVKANIQPLGFYVEKDFKRLERLVQSDNLDDLNEAESLVNFYIQAGKFQRDIENPFFDQSDIFIEDANGRLTSDYKLPQDVIDQYQEWANRATKFKNDVDVKKQELFVKTINENPNVKRTYGQSRGNIPFSLRELMKSDEGMKDTNFVDMWIMDITQGIFSHNGMLPQVAFSYLNQRMTDKLEYSREIEKKIDEINPRVIKKLSQLRQTLKANGIDSKGVTYQLFKEFTKDGHETGGIIQKFVKEFTDKQREAKDRFDSALKMAKSYTDKVTRDAAFKKAFRDFRIWKRMNTIVFEFGKIPEIINNPEFSGFQTSFDVTGAPAYKQKMIDLLGQREYDRQVEEQTKNLRRYLSDKESILDTYMEQEGVTNASQLSQNALNDFEAWKKRNSPAWGVEDYYKVILPNDFHFDNYGNYNIFIPRKFTTVPQKNSTGDRYDFTDTNTSTGFYNEVFEKFIENDPDLGEFHALLMDAIENIRAVAPVELLSKMTANSLPALQKSFTEVLNENKITTNILHRVFEAFGILWENVRTSFGVVKQSEISTAVQDPVTGKWTYKVNDNFMRGNQFAVENKMKIEKAKFLQAFADPNVKTIRRFSVLSLDRFTPESLTLLAQYLNMDTVDVTAIEQKLGSKNVDIGRIIRDYAVHQVVQTQSFDLAKVVKYSVNMAMMYAARTEALPVIELVRKHYEDIKKPRTNNLGKQLKNLYTDQLETEGKRENAIRQFKHWFDRVVLDNYSLKQTGAFGSNREKALVGRNIYTKEERNTLNEINDLLEKETDQDRIKELQDIKKHLGKVRTFSAAFDNLLMWIRTMKLGYNMSSAITNSIEGYISNMLVAASGEYFDPKEIYYGYYVIKHSFIRNATFGKWSTGLATKNRRLMDKFRVIMDSRNELQKSSVKTYSDRLSWLNPMALNQRVEFNNQSVLMIAMLRSMKINDVNGNESSIWDALDINGDLKPEFKTPDNEQNWMELTGENYKAFKEKLNAVIVKAHGNYDELRGMMAKGNIAGKAMMMFKTWLPMQLHWRFATQQDDIATGTIGVKGRYLSYTPGSAALHGLALGSIMFGPFGALGGAVIGAGAGWFISNQQDMDTGVNTLMESVISAKVLLKKMIGMPVNSLLGTKIDTSGKEFDAWVDPNGQRFSQRDANALKSNMSDIANQLTFILMLLLVKGFFYDDDDEKDSTERKIHNFFVNKLWQLATQGTMYVNPVEMWESTVSRNAVWKYLQDIGKFSTEFVAWVEGRGIKATGPNAGELGVVNELKKSFLPGMFQEGFPGYEIIQGEFPKFGMDKWTEKQFFPTPWDQYFKSEEKLEQEDNKRERAEMRKDLQDDFEIRKEELRAEGLSGEELEKQIKKEIRQKIDAELPTPAQLKKKGLTREEFLNSKE
jgi:hypothetical protein